MLTLYYNIFERSLKMEIIIIPNSPGNKRRLHTTTDSLSHPMHGQITVGYLRSFFFHFCNIINYQNHNEQHYKAEQ